MSCKDFTRCGHLARPHAGRLCIPPKNSHSPLCDADNRNLADWFFSLRMEAVARSTSLCTIPPRSPPASEWDVGLVSMAEACHIMNDLTACAPTRQRTSVLARQWGAHAWQCDNIHCSLAQVAQYAYDCIAGLQLSRTSRSWCRGQVNISSEMQSNLTQY